MLLHSLRAFCKAPGAAGSIWKYLEALARATGVSERFPYGFRTELHFANAYVGMGSLGTACFHRDCNAIGDAAKSTSRVSSSIAQNTILSLLIIHSIPSCQIYVAIDNPWLVPSVSYHIICNYLWKYARAADVVSYAEHFQCNGCRCFSHLYKIRDRMQVTRVFRNCGECQG